MANTNTIYGKSDIYASLNGNAPSVSSSKSSADNAQQRFLSLLTAQLKNQDPMSPMDSAQMTSQLAQLNTVDGIERLNATMQILSASSNLAASIQSSSLVGRDVLVDGDILVLKEGGGSGGALLETPVDELRVDIKDASGNFVRTLRLGPQEAGTIKFNWDGRGENGQPLAFGKYRIEVMAYQGGKSSSVTPLEKNTVMSVTPGKTGISINFPSGSSVGLDSVRQFI